MGKSNPLKPLRIKKDIQTLRKKGRSFSHQWLKAVFFLGEEKGLFVAWAIPKKYIPRAVDRNRLRRWGRENLKKGLLKRGKVLMIFLPKEKGFYKTKLRRKDFDEIFKITMDKLGGLEK